LTSPVEPNSWRKVDLSAKLWLSSAPLKWVRGLGMTARFGILGLALLLAACGGETGMRCEYSGGNLDAIKAQVATLKAGGTSEDEVVKTLGKPASSTPSADGGKSDEYDFT
jgi:hypothetical protein